MASRSWLIVLAVGLWVTSPAHAADAPLWTLSASVQRAVAVAPELRAAEATVGMRQGELTQAGTWPNPNVTARADNRLGREDYSGGYDTTELSFNQPLPLRRLGRQTRMAEANLSAAQETQRFEQLRLENRIAHAFHALQLTDARLTLARERLRQADAYLQTGARGGGLVRYLSNAERLRLNIVRAQAEQAVASSEGEYSEALSQFRALLALPRASTPTLVALTLPASPPSLAALEVLLARHPALQALRSEQDAAQAGVDVARSHRFADPVISVFRERDFINGSRQDVTGIGLSVQVPLWNRNNGGVASARADAERAEAQRRAQERDADARLRLAHQHLQHLIEQAQTYRSEVLDPAERLLATTRKTFAVGHADILTLVDAHNTYFEARGRYIELLQEAQREAADLRFAAGVSVLDKATTP